MKLLVAKLCPTVPNPSLPGSSVHEISQVGILEWLSISSFRVSSLPREQTCIGKQSLYHWATKEAWFN